MISIIPKPEARRQAGEIWGNLPPSRRKALQQSFAVFLDDHAFSRFFCTVSVGHELDLLTLLENRGVPIYLPVAEGAGLMSFHYYASGPDRGRLAPGLFGIPVPGDGEVAVPGHGDLCVLPALACNPGHFRLGRGGGYFDRYFSVHPGAKNCRKVTVLPIELTEIHFSEQLHDLKLDEVLTDT